MNTGKVWLVGAGPGDPGLQPYSRLPFAHRGKNKQDRLIS